MRAAGERAAGSKDLQMEVQKLVQGAGCGWEGCDELSIRAEVTYEGIRVHLQRLKDRAGDAKQVLATYRVQARAVAIEATSLAVETTRLRWGRSGSVGPPEEVRCHILAIESLTQDMNVHYEKLRKVLKKMQKSVSHANRRLDRIRAQIEEIGEACSAPIKERRRLRLSGRSQTGTLTGGVQLSDGNEADANLIEEGTAGVTPVLGGHWRGKRTGGQWQSFGVVGK